MTRKHNQMRNRAKQHKTQPRVQSGLRRTKVKKSFDDDLEFDREDVDSSNFHMQQLDTRKRNSSLVSFRNKKSPPRPPKIVENEKSSSFNPKANPNIAAQLAEGANQLRRFETRVEKSSNLLARPSMNRLSSEQHNTFHSNTKTPAWKRNKAEMDDERSQSPDTNFDQIIEIPGQRKYLFDSN